MGLCCIKNCKREQYSGCGFSFHGLPKDPELRDKWIKAMKWDRGLPKTMKVCSRHFKKSDYENSSLYSVAKKLKPQVVPSIFPWTPEWVDLNKKPDIESEEKFEKMIDLDNDEDDDENIITDDSYDDSDDNSETIISDNIPENNNVNQIKQQANVQSNKVMVISPILEIKRIEDAISTVSSNKNESREPVVSIKRFKPNSEEIKTNISPIGNTSNNIMMIQPITENECVEDIITTKTFIKGKNNSPVYIDDSNSNISSTNLSFNKAFSVKIYDGGNQNKINENNIQSQNYKLSKDISIKSLNNPTEKELMKKIEYLNEKRKRCVTSNRQLKSVIRLIKNCKDFHQVQQILAIYTGNTSIPTGLKCDSILVVDPTSIMKTSKN